MLKINRPLQDDERAVRAATALAKCPSRRRAAGTAYWGEAAQEFRRPLSPARIEREFAVLRPP